MTGSTSTLLWILLFVVMIVGMIIQRSLTSKFRKYSKIPLHDGLTGKEVAEKMLRESGITDVEVRPTRGMLTDFYNPGDRTINLSEGVYSSRSVAAAAVAAHETGHALQHHVGYSMLRLRTALVPVVTFSSNILSIVLLAGLLLVRVFPELLLFGIILFAATTLFSFVTLPVEIDASRRALSWLERSGVTGPEDHKYAVSALRSAAYTYVIAAIGSLATLLYYISIYSGNRR